MNVQPSRPVARSDDAAATRSGSPPASSPVAHGATSPAADVSAGVPGRQAVSAAASRTQPGPQPSVPAQASTADQAHSLPTTASRTQPPGPEELLAALDPDQREVAEHLSGPLCVLAGAGTGKTRAITYRIAHGVAVGAYQPTQVLAVTFTARAAGEMRSRLADLGVPGVQARTFHSAALRQLTYFWPTAIGGTRPPIQEHKAGLVGAAARRVGLGTDRATVRDLAAEVEWAKVTMTLPEDYAARAAAAGRTDVAGLDPQTVATVLMSYEDAKTERGVIDFEDVLLLMVGVLADREDVAARDRADSKVTSFLTAADGVTTVDNSDMDFQQTLDVLITLVADAVEVQEYEQYAANLSDYELDEGDEQIIAGAQKSIQDKEEVNLDFAIHNTNRAVGTMLSGIIAKKYGEAGLPDKTVNVKFKGSAGQSFGAFLVKGVDFKLEGETNDYFAKGLSGGRISILPPIRSNFSAEDNIIAGNTGLYGATSGELYINGKVGERFGVRNSGAIAVIEGAGDHCCEYMTGGRVVVLGETGRNFAAGMSGGVAYVWDKNHNFDYFCNMDMVEINLVEDSTYRKELHELIRQHYLYTGSKLARTMLDDWNHYVEDFIQVVPIEYKRVLQEEQVKKLQQKIADMQRDY